MKSSLLLLLGAFSLSACAQAPEEQDAQPVPAAAAVPAQPVIEADPDSPDGRALEAIRRVNPQLVVDGVGAAPIAGFREVVVGGQVVYVSDDGRYLLQGSLFDVQARRDLSQEGLARVRRDLLAEVPAEDRIVFAPDNPRYTVTVFTDVECGYCRRLHEEMGEYNRLGIAIEYLAFPRRGVGSEDYDTMVSVWCADDRQQAMTAAKSGRRVPPRICDNPVAAQHALGQRVGLTGTPMIVTGTGVQMPGYVPPAALLEALEQMAANP